MLLFAGERLPAIPSGDHHDEDDDGVDGDHEDEDDDGVDDDQYGDGDLHSHLIREGVQKKRFFLGKSPKLLVGGGQES